MAPQIGFHGLAPRSRAHLCFTMVEGSNRRREEGDVSRGFRVPRATDRQGPIGKSVPNLAKNALPFNSEQLGRWMPTGPLEHPTGSPRSLGPPPDLTASARRNHPGLNSGQTTNLEDRRSTRLCTKNRLLSGEGKKAAPDTNGLPGPPGQRPQRRQNQQGNTGFLEQNCTGQGPTMWITVAT